MHNVFNGSHSRKNTTRSSGGFDTVRACLEIIWACQYEGKRLAFWALENPKARLRWFLGKPNFTFNPFDFGDRYRKPTDIWGMFNEPVKNPVELNKEELERMGNNSRRLPILDGILKGDRKRADQSHRKVLQKLFSKQTSSVRSYPLRNKRSSVAY